MSTDGTALTSGASVITVGDFTRFLIVDRVGMTVELIPHLFGTVNHMPLGRRGLYCYWRTSSAVLRLAGFSHAQGALEAGGCSSAWKPTRQAHRPSWQRPPGSATGSGSAGGVSATPKPAARARCHPMTSANATSAGGHAPGTGTPPVYQGRCTHPRLRADGDTDYRYVPRRERPPGCTSYDDGSIRA